MREDGDVGTPLAIIQATTNKETAIRKLRMAVTGAV